MGSLAGVTVSSIQNRKELVFLRTGKKFPGGRKQEYCTESKAALDFMNHQNRNDAK